MANITYRYIKDFRETSLNRFEHPKFFHLTSNTPWVNYIRKKYGECVALGFGSDVW